MESSCESCDVIAYCVNLKSGNLNNGMIFACFAALHAGIWDRGAASPSEVYAFVESEDWSQSGEWVTVFRLPLDGMAKVKEAYFGDDAEAENREHRLFAVVIGSSAFCSDFARFMASHRDGAVDDDAQVVIDRLGELTHNDVLWTDSRAEGFKTTDMHHMFENLVDEAG